MKRISFIILISITCLFGGSGFDKVGSTSAQFLKMGVGARSMGMGGSFVGLANDASALFWNPAGMIYSSGIHTLFSHNDWALDISHDFIGTIIPVKNSGRLGISFSALTMGEKEITTVYEPDGTGLYYSVMDLSMGASYAQMISDRLSYGLTFKYIRTSAHNESASTVAFDIGSILRTAFHNLKIGMALSNFGGELQYKGRDLIGKTDVDEGLDGNQLTDATLATESWPIPLMIRIGISVDLLGMNDAFIKNHFNRITLVMDAEHPNDSHEHLNIGCEYSYKDLIFLRGGYRINYDENSATFGAGIQSHIFGIGDVSFNYSLLPFGPFGNTNQVSIEFQLK